MQVCNNWRWRRFMGSMAGHVTLNARSQKLNGFHLLQTSTITSGFCKDNTHSFWKSWSLNKHGLLSQEGTCGEDGLIHFMSSHLHLFSQVCLTYLTPVVEFCQFYIYLKKYVIFSSLVSSGQSGNWMMFKTVSPAAFFPEWWHQGCSRGPINNCWMNE